MITLAVICLLVALIAYLRAKSGTNPKFEKMLAIIFLVIGIVILIFALIAKFK